MNAAAAEITTLLHQIRGGDQASVDCLIGKVYDDLHRLAARCMSTERRDHTLQPTALVHEAYLRIFEGAQVNWQDRAHFFAVAGQVMRRVLVDSGRKAHTSKRASGPKISLDDSFGEPGVSASEWSVVDQLLEKLTKTDPASARVVELKFFAGLSEREIAEVLQLPAATVRGHWLFARSWLVSHFGNSAKADD